MSSLGVMLGRMNIEEIVGPLDLTGLEALGDDAETILRAVIHWELLSRKIAACGTVIDNAIYWRGDDE